MSLEISIITVNYNGFKDTCELIESLKIHLGNLSYELFVVDNASKENEAEKLQKLYPWIHSIRSEKNLGFAGGNNLALAKAKGKFVLLINNDTYITDNSLINLIAFMEANKNIGAVSPKIKFAEPPNDLQFAGYTEFTRITLRNSLIGFGEKDSEQYNTPIRSPYLHGAAMMVRNDAIKKAGPMPEIYFLYYEELDWCEQIKKAGYELWYQPSSTVYHKESRSVGRESTLKRYYMTRNRLLYASRNLTNSEKYLSIVYQLAIAIPKSITSSLLNCRLDLAKATIKGVSAFCNLKK